MHSQLESHTKSFVGVRSLLRRVTYNPRLMYTLLLMVVAVVLTVTPSSVLAGECRADNDCVPATCCHSSICVPKGEETKCSGGETCSTECRPFTVDCGGKCFCTELKKCAALLNLGVDPGHHDDGVLPHKKKKYTYGYTKVRGFPKKHGGG